MAKVVYACNFCGTIFNTEQGAENCEKTHRAIKSVTPQTYNNYDKRYPTSVVCKMANGSEVEYVLKRVIKEKEGR